MKPNFILAVLIVGFAGFAHAGGVGTYPASVAAPKTVIKPSMALAAVETAYSNFTAASQSKAANGDTVVVLSNVSEGTVPDLKGGSTKTSQYTTLTLVVGADGTVKSYDMVQTDMKIDSNHPGPVYSTRDVGNDCFSDCSTSASTIVAAKAAATAAATTNQAPVTIPAANNTSTSLQSQSTLAQQKAAVSPSAP